MARVIANLVLDALERGGGRVELVLTTLAGAVELRVRTPRTLAHPRHGLARSVVGAIVAAHRGTLDARTGVCRLVLPVTQ